ncbi:glycosyltransferase [Limisalsivibrio acetivorans]|uniref:glycosyltransferase n=1 Tax=Limisalsivibrio acetivorans TaxID=1304888 RepID=UPI0003B69DD4|nr:glycosyltransferase [Limisalsivibrio acetivorans]
MKIWILLPAFNEEDSIPLMFPKIDKYMKQEGFDYSIVALDDGSSDDTFCVLEGVKGDYPLVILRHEINRGLGETERDLFEYVSEHGSDDDIAIRMDCDDTHEPHYILSMIKKVQEGYDVVNTSRFRKGGGQMGVNSYRSFISYMANLFMAVMFNIKGVRDYSCGFRAYRVKALKYAVGIFGNSFIQLKGLGFTSTLEIIVKLKLMGCSFAEVPFVLRYDQKASPSKMISSITTLGYFSMAILYHWPFGGWRPFYKHLAEIYRKDPEEAVNVYNKYAKRRTTICQIGG